MESDFNTFPPTWPLVPLSSICQVGAGNGAPQGDVYFSQGKYPFVRMQDVGRTQSPYLKTTVDRLNDIAVEKHSLRLWPANALLIPKSGASVALNKRALLSEPSYVVSHLAIVVPGELVNPEYLYHLFCTLDMMRLALDPSYPSLRISDLAKIRIPLPPLSEQRRIVESLSEAEEVRRSCAQGEIKTAELIPAMFEELFGDPVRNPKKWEIQPLASVIVGTPKNGLYKSAGFYGEGTPIIRIGDFTNGILRTGKNLQRLRVEEDEVESYKVSNGQILINRVNSIEHLGKSLLVASLVEPTVYESNMMRLDPKKEKVLPDFLIGCLQHESLIAKLRAKAKKAINQASINQTDVLTLNIPVPPLSVQERFAFFVAQAEEIRLLSEAARRKERTLNSSLLAHALSGQLTAEWRETRKGELALEARLRDVALKIVGASLTLHKDNTIQEIEQFFAQRADSIYSDLNREQRNLLLEIERMIGGVGYPRYFSAQMLGDYISKGSLRRNPLVIESHLIVFAARGIIIPVSREEQTEDTGEFIFSNAYRLPLEGDQSSEVELGEPQVSDYARLRELERLAAQLEKERILT